MANVKEKVCIPEEKDYRLVFSKADTIIEEHSLGELLEDLERGYIVDDIAMQRDSGQWSGKDMSLLIHTVLKGLSIYPISLDQENTGSGQIKRLTDGKQRLNVFESYKNNEFALYKFTPSVTVKGVKMIPQLDDEGQVIKKRNKVVMVPELDERDKPIVEKKTYKIAGKYFSQLPDDLQYQFLHYKKMKQLVHIGYTEEETKLQMLRDNTSVKMNPAQIGVVVAGEDLATWLKNLREHNLFLNHSKWSAKQKKQSAIERCVVESFVLSDDISNWQDSYPKNNEFFIANDSEDNRDNYISLINEFDAIVTEYPEIWDKLDKNNLYIILAAYCHFCNMNANYSKKSFGKFLCAWFNEIRDTTDYDPKENEDKSGTKHKTTVLGKLAILDIECGKYMGMYGEKSDRDTENFGDIVNTDEMAENNKLKPIIFTNALHGVLDKYDPISENNKTAFDYATLMISARYPGYNDFNMETLQQFGKYYEELSVGEQKLLLEDAETYTAGLKEIFDDAFMNEKFLTKDNTLCMFDVFVKAWKDDVDEDIVKDWMQDFSNCEWENGEYLKVRDNQTNYITDRISILRVSLEKYINN